MHRSKNPSFDNVISAGKQCRRQFETECLSSLKIDEQFNFCGLLDRQIRHFRPLEPGRYKRRPSEMIRKTAAIAHQTSGRDELTKSEDRGDRVVDCQPGELSAPTEKE